MSNRVDFFQAEQNRLALASAVVVVQVDGVLCPSLVPIEIVRADWPEFSRARLAYNPAGDAEVEPTCIEDIETLFATGRNVCIRQVYNKLAPAGGAESIPVFVGQIEGIEGRLGLEGERVEIIARDFSANLRRVRVYGRRVKDAAGAILHLCGGRCCFNEDGRPNATKSAVGNNGSDYTLFSLCPTESKFWTYAEVIDYLLCEYLPAGQLLRPTIEQLRSLTEQRTVHELDVTGLNLLEALQRCCEEVGLRFKFVPRIVPTGPKEAIDIYRPSFAKSIELNCQPKGEQFSISKTNIATISIKRNRWPVTRRYVGLGDLKLYEATFNLVKAWNPADEDTDYDKFSPKTNADFYKVRNVYRKWCLNEAGDYSSEPYNRGAAFDFSKIFEDDFVRRRRRFFPALTRDKQSKSLGYYLQVSYDDGEHWWQYAYGFDNLTDECGVWLSSPELDSDTWLAAMDDTLRFGITASVVGDARLSCVVADGPVGSVSPVVEHIISVPGRYKYRKVSSQSIFSVVSDGSMGGPDETDDTAALYEYVRTRAEGGSEVIETADVRTPYLVFGYDVADLVRTSPESRDLLSCGSDNRSIMRIVHVRMDFEKQCTDLRVVRRRKVV